MMFSQSPKVSVFYANFTKETEFSVNPETVFQQDVGTRAFQDLEFSGHCCLAFIDC